MSRGKAGYPLRATWARFVQGHLHDYTAPGIRVWVLGVGLGCGLAAWSLLSVLGSPALWLSAATVGLMVLVASQFPIRVPGTSFSFSPSDAFLYGALILFGTPVAVVVAGADALVGAVKTTRRLASRLFGPSAAMLGMFACGACFHALKSVLAGWGLSDGATQVLAISGGALLHLLVGGGAVQFVLSLKHGRQASVRQWLADNTWMGAVMVASACFVGLFVSVTGPLGMQTMAAAAATALVVLWLVNLTLSRWSEEQTAQEERIAAAQEDARINQQRFTAAFEQAAGGLAIVGADGVILRANRSLCVLLDRDVDALVGQPFLDCVATRDRADLSQRLAHLRESPDQVVATEVSLEHPAGGRWVSLHASLFDDPGTSGAGLIYQLHDISDRRVAQEQLQYAAYHDAMTSLPNRLAYLQQLQSAIDRSKADPSATFAALLLDLDRFKMVNDSLGHAAGNELLVEVGRRLAESVRPGDFVARLGGDEFGLMFDRIGSQEEAVRLAQRVADTIAQPMQIQASEFAVQCSIGLTLSDLGHRTGDEMIRDADIAMYDAKGKGPGRISVFDTSMHAYVADRLHMEAQLRRAIGAGQITLAFQPIVDLAEGRLLGFEALARWRHPEMGQVDAPRFIALAEESGFIAQLTPWVIEMASLQMAAWQRVLPGGDRLKMHVNVSARDLELPGFTTSVATGLARARLSGHALTLEITETSLMRSVDHALPVMESLRRIGVTFSIDDFGTGYSSLSYLGTLPIDSLKIDRSFVLGLDRGPQNVEIVRAILRLGQTLHMHVIAEGVETQEHLAALRDIGVESGQGYLFGRPVPAADMLGQLKSVGLHTS